MSTITKELTKLDNIKFLFSKVKKENKKDFYQLVADEFGVKPSTVRTGWFIRFEIRDTYNLQEQLIKFMQNYISNQPE